jgi:DNA polymerase III subunit epsilon
MFEYIAFDLETTGVKPAEDFIVEVGAVRFVNGKACDAFCRLVDPGVSIPVEASAVNGITDAMVTGKPKIEDVLPEFAAFCGDVPLVAHNAPFDYKFTLQAVKLHRSSAPSGIVLDTLTLARRIFPGLANYKLGTLVRHFGFPGGTFHRAEEDSTYCGMIFARILDTLMQRGESVAVNELVALTGKEEMRFPQYKAAPDQLSLF